MFNYIRTIYLSKDKKEVEKYNCKENRWVLREQLEKENKNKSKFLSFEKKKPKFLVLETDWLITWDI